MKEINPNDLSHFTRKSAQHKERVPKLLENFTVTVADM